MMRALFARLRREDGVTLMELTITMGLLGVLFAAFAMVIGSTIRLGGEVEANSALQAEVRAAVDSMAAELRQAYTGDTADPPIESMTTNSIVFDSPDRQQPFHVRRIGYRLNAGKLERREAISTDTDGPPWALTGYTAAPWRRKFDSLTSTSVFSYSDMCGAAITNLADVGKVRTVAIAVTVATATAPTRPYTYRTSVTLRTPQPLPPSCP